jgi:predicted nucleic acid-binding protein
MTKKIIRIMLDTNVLFSAMYKADGTPFNAFAKASEMPYRLVLCDQIVDELRRNFNKKIPAYIPALERFLAIAHYDLISITPDDKAAPDEEKISHLNDRPLVRAARKTNVDILVTGDKDILNSSITTPKIMTARDFVDMKDTW